MGMISFFVSETARLKAGRAQVLLLRCCYKGVELSGRGETLRIIGFREKKSRCPSPQNAMLKV